MNSEWKVSLSPSQTKFVEWNRQHDRLFVAVHSLVIDRKIKKKSDKHKYCRLQTGERETKFNLHLSFSSRCCNFYVSMLSWKWNKDERLNNAAEYPSEGWQKDRDGSGSSCKNNSPGKQEPDDVYLPADVFSHPKRQRSTKSSAPLRACAQSCPIIAYESRRCSLPFSLVPFSVHLLLFFFQI